TALGRQSGTCGLLLSLGFGRHVGSPAWISTCLLQQSLCRFVLDRYFQIVLAIGFRLRPLPASNIDLDGRQQQRGGRQRRIALRTHGNELLLRDAVTYVNVSLALCVDCGFPGEIIPAVGLVV